MFPRTVDSLDTHDSAANDNRAPLSPSPPLRVVIYLALIAVPWALIVLTVRLVVLP